MNGGINVGGIYADLQIDSSHAERGLANARVAMQAIEKELAALDKQVKLGAIDLAEYGVRANELTTTFGQLAAATSAAYGRIGVTSGGLDVLNAGLTQSSTAAQRFSRSMMQAGYIVDDLQYSIMATVNNIGPFALAMGAGAGLAGGIQIAGVAAAQLYSHLDDVQELFGQSKTLTEAESMEKLGKETAKTADEQKRYNDYKRQQSEAESILEQKSKEHLEQSKAVDKAIDQVAGPEFTKALGKIISGKEEIPDQELDKIKQRASEISGPDSVFHFNPAGPSMRDRSMIAGTPEAEKRFPAMKFTAERLKADYFQKRAARLMAQAKDDPESLQKLIDLVRQDSGQFPAGILGDLEAALPENIKQQKEWEEAGQANAKRYEIEENARIAQEKADKASGRTAKRSELDAKRLKREQDKQLEEQTKEQVRIAKMLVPDASTLVAEKYDSGVFDNGLAMSDLVPEIARKLEAAGMNPADAKLAAQGMLQSREDMDPDALRADRERRNDRKESEAKKAENEAEKAVRDKEKQHRETRRMAEDAVPGLSAIAEREAAAGILGGGSMDQVAASIAATLREAGLSKEDAAAQAADLAKEGASALYGKANNAAMGKDKKESFSQVFNSDDLRSRVQGGISNKQQEQTDLLKMAVERLTEIVQVSGKTLKIKVD